MPKVEIDSEVLEGMVGFVEQSVGYASKQAEVEATVAERGPQVVETLIKQGFIDGDKKQAALRAIKDPVKVLESLEKTAKAKMAKASAAEPDKLGEGGGVKEAGVGSAEKTDESVAMQAANRRFMRSLGF